MRVDKQEFGSEESCLNLCPGQTRHTMVMLSRFQIQFQFSLLDGRHRQSRLETQAKVVGAKSVFRPDTLYFGTFFHHFKFTIYFRISYYIIYTRTATRRLCNY